VRNREVDIFSAVGSDASHDRSGTATCATGLNLESIRSSPSLQQTQKATHAKVKTAMSKAFMRSRWRWRALR